MRKWIALSVLMFFVLPMFVAYGSDVGNLLEGSKGDFRLELGADNFQRELKIEDDITYSDSVGTDVIAFAGALEGGRETVNRIYLKASYLASPKTELYLKLGQASLRTKIDQVAVAFVTVDDWGWDTYAEYQPGSSGLSDPGTFFGIGIKEVLSETKNLKVISDFQILMLSKTDLELALYEDYYEDDTGWLDHNALGIDTVESIEYQLSVFCKKTSGELKPYAGAKLTYFTNTYELIYVTDSDYFASAEVSKDIEAKPVDYLGFFAGVDWQLGEKTRFNLELRMRDEVGVSGGFSMGF